MHIGIDISRANESQRTGVEWYVFYVIQELKKIIPSYIRVTVYSPTPLQGELAELPHNWTSKVLGWWPKRLWTQGRLSWEMFRHPPDVLFIPGHVMPLVHPRKTIMTVHDIAAQAFPEAYSSFEQWYSLWSAKHAMTYLSDVIVPSEFTKQEIKKYIPQKKQRANITVVPHGCEERFFTHVSSEQRIVVQKKYGITAPYLYSVGRLEEKKNTKNIVQVFHEVKKDLPELSLVLVGKPGHGAEDVMHAIAHSPYKQDIIQPGWVEQEDMPALMQGAAALIFPSLYEGFGLPIIEALASGTPVICSTGLTFEDLAQEAARYVDPKDIDGLAIAVKETIREQDNWDADAARTRAAHFSWREAAQKTAQVLLS